MLRLFGAVILACFILTAAKMLPTEIKMRDFDGDGRKEALVYYENGIPQKAVADRDQDGFVEATYHYKEGRRDSAEIDLNKDGRTEQWISYTPEGEAWKSAYDFDQDGRADYWTYARNGSIYKWEQDRNGDGRADVRTYYETGSPFPAVFRQTYDNDFDGDFEVLSGLTPRKPETRIPHSLAEALLN